MALLGRSVRASQSQDVRSENWRGGIWHSWAGQSVRPRVRKCGPKMGGVAYGTAGPVTSCGPESGSAVRESEGWRGGGAGRPRPTRVRRASRSAGILQELRVAQGDEVLAGGGEAVEGVAAVLVVLLDEQVLGARLDGGVDDLAPLQGALPHLGELHDPGECLHEALDITALQHVESLGP